MLLLIEIQATGAQHKYKENEKRKRKKKRNREERGESSSATKFIIKIIANSIVQKDWTRNYIHLKLNL